MPKDIHHEALKEMQADNNATYWLSFADPDKPKGKQFLGVAIVFAPGFSSAILITNTLGINPGGAVQCQELSEEYARDIKQELYFRLLSEDDLEKEDLI